MCRSIKTLRPPVLPGEASDEEIGAAALQYVRKVSGFRAPAAHNREAFDRAVAEVAEATRRLLTGIEVRGAAKPSQAELRAEAEGQESRAARQGVTGAGAGAGRRTNRAARVPATNSASSETAAPSHDAPSHWAPR